jgi:plasmid stability protein
MQTACMATIQVRDVPDDVQAELVRRAKAAHQSLQQYLRGLLVRQARRPDPATFWAEVGERVRGGDSSYQLAEAVEDVHALRAGDGDRA